MYRQHFALKRYPFESTLPADELFKATAQLEAQARIGHLLELRGIGLLTGEAGCGKTTICRQAVDSLHAGRYRVCYVNLATGSVLDTYNAIAAEFGLPGLPHPRRSPPRHPRGSLPHGRGVETAPAPHPRRSAPPPQ